MKLFSSGLWRTIIKKSIFWVVLSLLLVFRGRTLLSDNIANWGHLIQFERLKKLTQLNCLDVPQETEAVDIYKVALEIDRTNLSAWRGLVQEESELNRPELEQYISDINNKFLENAFSEYQLFSPPGKWVHEIPWTVPRCNGAWRLWTVGLFHASRGEYSEAIAEYQAGLSLTLGKAPNIIRSEYYTLLIENIRENSVITPVEKLRIAKFLFMSGSKNEAYDELLSLISESSGKEVDACKFFSVVNLLDSYQENSLASSSIQSEIQNQCKKSFEQSTLTEPEWKLSEKDQIINSDGRLIGFDLDEDILNAGLDVVGQKFILSGDGEVRKRSFRQMNLWPNSGNDWYPLSSYWTCLPGYFEPSWIKSCASTRKLIATNQNLENRIGTVIAQDQNGGPDTLISTSSITISAQNYLICGGKWFLVGNLPSAQVGKYYISGFPPRYYDMVISLNTLKPGYWQDTTSVQPPLPSDYEYFFWIKPQAGNGSGELSFDDLFCFTQLANK